MYEVEVKVPANLETVRDRIAELDAAWMGVVVQSDTYYDAPHRSFAETDEALRVRRERAEQSSTEESPAAELPTGESPAAELPTEESPAAGSSPTRVTYKGPLVDAETKTREEVETRVEDGEALAEILANLGFEPVATVRKERERYRIDDYTVTLDAVDDVGEYVEVETEASEADLEPARDGAFAVVESLGLDPDRTTRTSYLELLLGG